jgi:hypothetical protein
VDCEIFVTLNIFWCFCTKNRNPEAEDWQIKAFQRPDFWIGSEFFAKIVMLFFTKCNPVSCSNHLKYGRTFVILSQNKPFVNMQIAQTSNPIW